MNTALIFAGGTGQRMNSRSKPKQFLEMYGKPILIYTLEHFEEHSEIDNIVIVCLKDWIKELKGLIKRYDITKVKKIVPGGNTGYDSIYNGLLSMKDFSDEEDVVLIHDGVRPLINEELITNNIRCVKKYGNCITVEPVKEGVIRSSDGEYVESVLPRAEMYYAKAPQSFKYGKIMELYEKANDDGYKTIDSSHLCSLYNESMHIVLSSKNNIKITEPSDYYIYRALYEATESQQIFGI